VRGLLLFGIRCYWRLIPPHRRRSCLFAKSCSRFVFETAERDGLMAGLAALAGRYRSCRAGYVLLDSRDADGMRLIRLADDSVIRADQLAASVIPL
jgi:uncharacterized protein